MSEYGEFTEWLREEAQEAREVGRDLRASSFENTAQAIERLEAQNERLQTSLDWKPSPAIFDELKATKDQIAERKADQASLRQHVNELSGWLADARAEIERKDKALDLVIKQAEVYKRDKAEYNRARWSYIQDICDKALAAPAPEPRLHIDVVSMAEPDKPLTVVVSKDSEGEE